MAWQFTIHRCRRWRSVLVGMAVIAAGLNLGDQTQAGAADVEVRDFTVIVDGKRAGDYRMTITHQNDGSVSMEAQSSVHVTVLLVPVYSYSYHGVEVWKDGRLEHFESSGNDNGKHFAISAVTEGNALHFKLNGGERIARPDVWLTSCWQLPDARFRNQNVPLVGCDNGQDISGHLQYVSTDPLIVNGMQQNCAHYQVLNIVPHEVWYDAQERMVRHEWVADGHRTVLQLARIQR